MFLRRHRKHAAGETYEYWTLCESQRTAAGPRQKVVATFGKLTGEEPREEAGWEQLEALLDGRPIAPRQLRLGEPPQQAPQAPGPRWELVDVRGVRVERARDFGEAFLGLALWRRLGLHSLLADLIEPGDEEPFRQAQGPERSRRGAVADGRQRARGRALLRSAFGAGHRRALPKALSEAEGVCAQCDGGSARSRLGEGE